MRYVFGLVCIVGLWVQQSACQEKVEWLSFEEAIEKMEKEEKKIFVDMYTDWCGWCKKMDKATFQQPHIAKYLNEYYYPVKFDAEYKEEIVFEDKTYKFIRSGRRGYHELAAELCKSLGKLSFPTTIFINEEMEVLQPIAGYIDPQKFEVIMTYFGEDHFKKTPWKKYSETYYSMTQEKQP